MLRERGLRRAAASPPETGVGPAAGPGGGGNSPSASPMMMPVENEGKKAQARMWVHIALNMLERALPEYGAESPEGKTILRALNSISSKFGERPSQGLQSAELDALAAAQRPNQIQQMLAGGGRARASAQPAGAVPSPMENQTIPGMMQ